MLCHQKSWYSSQVDVVCLCLFVWYPALWPVVSAVLRNIVEEAHGGLWRWELESYTEYVMLLVANEVFLARLSTMPSSKLPTSNLYLGQFTALGLRWTVWNLSLFTLTFYPEHHWLTTSNICWKSPSFIANKTKWSSYINDTTFLPPTGISKQSCFRFITKWTLYRLNNTDHRTHPCRSPTDLSNHSVRDPFTLTLNLIFS